MESDILRQHSLALSPWPSKVLLNPTHAHLNKNFIYLCIIPVNLVSLSLLVLSQHFGNVLLISSGVLFKSTQEISSSSCRGARTDFPNSLSFAILLVVLHLRVRVKGSIGERRLWVRPCSSISISHVLDKYIRPVGGGLEYIDCIPCRVVRPHHQKRNAFGMTLNCIWWWGSYWISGNCGLLLQSHYFQVPSDPER